MEIIGFIIGFLIAIVLANRAKQPPTSRSQMAERPLSSTPQSSPPMRPIAPPILDKTPPVTEEVIPAKLHVPRPPAHKNYYIEQMCNKTQRNIKTNIYLMTCTCDDFHQSHSLYAIGDIRRMCRHLNKAYKDEVSLNGLDLFIRAIIESGHGVKSNFIYLYDKNEAIHSEQVLFAFDKDNAWWDIFLLESQQVTRYGFDILSNRWSYNQAPSAKKEDLEKAVEEVLTANASQINRDIIQVRDIVSKVNTRKQLRNLEKRVERAEQKYGPDSTPAQDKKYEILCDALDIAENKLMWLQENE